MLFFNQYRRYVLMDKAGDDGGGGGGGGNPEPKNDPKPDDGEKVTMSKADYDKMMARMDALEGKKSDPKPDDDDDDDLVTKARKQREASDKTKNDSKSLERALRFDMGSKDWLKQNASLLPSDINDIFETANKESYDSPIQKDSAVKAGIIQSFFSVQSNVDLLTPGLKNQLEDYLKLTKNGKEEKAQSMYDNIFEPAFEMLKRVKKAEAVQKGHNDGGDDAYKTKLMGLSRKHYLGEKTQ